MFPLSIWSLTQKNLDCWFSTPDQHWNQNLRFQYEESQTKETSKLTSDSSSHLWKYVLAPLRNTLRPVLACER